MTTVALAGGPPAPFTALGLRRRLQAGWLGSLTAIALGQKDPRAAGPRWNRRSIGSSEQL